MNIVRNQSLSMAVNRFSVNLQLLRYSYRVSRKQKQFKARYDFTSHIRAYVK